MTPQEIELEEVLIGILWERSDLYAWYEDIVFNDD